MSFFAHAFEPKLEQTLLCRFGPSKRIEQWREC